MCMAEANEMTLYPVKYLIEATLDSYERLWKPHPENVGYRTLDISLEVH